MKYAVGIDLGTTNSAVAYVTSGGRTAMLSNELGDPLTPSAVYFDDEETVVGREAVKASLFDPGSVAICAKRDVGNEYCAEPIRDRQVPPELVQGCILKHLRELIDVQLDSDYRAVISVPAFFDDRRRQSVYDAAEIAGFENVAIVNEPTAAALAFAEQTGYLKESGAPEKSKKLLVYDLGGGTFDVTLVSLEPGLVTTLATDGDVRLGGYDWDFRLAQYAAQKFEARFGSDPRDDRRVLTRLIQLAEEVKHTLSVRERAVLPVEYEGHSLEVAITREQFEILTADLVERTSHTVRHVVEGADLAWDQIDHILLAGGSSRMPMAAKMLEQLSGRVPDFLINPDEATARGAALYAAFVMSEAGEAHHPLRLRVVDISTHSLGIEGVDPISGRKVNTILIQRYSPLPCEVSHRFVTREANQKSIAIKVLEGELENPAACLTVGKVVMRDLPAKLPKNHPIEVIYLYLRDGRLRVDLEVSGTEHRHSVVLERAGAMGSNRVDQWRTVVSEEAKLGALARVLENVLGVVVDTDSLS